MTRDTRAHIGHLAGLVYRGLEKHGRLSILDLSHKLGIWPWDVLLGVGWLMHEDKVKIKRKMAAMVVELKSD